MAKILGIDLGTTNSAMAIVEGGEPKVLENHEGNRTTPSVTAISKSGEKLVGILAKRQTVVNPKNTIFSIKRLIGRKFSDPEVARDKQWLSFDLKESSTGGVEIKMADRWYKPEEISAMVLAKLKADAEAKLGEKIELHSGGEMIRSFIHVKDVTAANIACLEKSQADYQIFNIGKV